MPILKIQDTDAIGSDPLRGLFNLVGSLGLSGEYYVGSDIDSRIFYENEGIVPITRDKVRLQFKPNITTEEINSLSEELQSLNIITHKTTIITPDSDNDPNTFNYNNYETDAFSFYNIRNEEYENYTLVNDERTLPNFCLGALWTRVGSETSNEQINYYTMFGTIESLQSSQILAGERPINNFEFDDESIGDIYGDYTLEDSIDYYKQMLISGSELRPQYRESNTHVYVDFDINFNDTKQIGNTPFFNKIRFPTSGQLFMFDIDEGEEVSRSKIVRAFQKSKMTDKILKSFRNSNSSFRNFTIQGTDNSNRINLRVYDVLEMFENISYNTRLTENDEMFLREVANSYSDDSGSPFSFYFYKIILLGKLREMISNKNFTNLIIDGEDHYKENVGFKVIKKIQGRSTPIQTFYFLNRLNLNEFIDTQIKFDRVYTYEVIAMYAIFGSNYTYQNVFLESERVLNFDFVNRPSVKIVEIPIANHVLRVVEPPPIVPEITFYNEMTSRNKLKIRMEHQDGNIVDEYMKKPLRPFRDNQEYIDKLEQYFSSPNILVTSGKTSDGIYEIYRLEEPPQSYRDFENALIATVQSNVVYSNGESSRNAMFVDLISHQKKYYYAFRVLTHRGNPSELSPIYVAEMYEDADETFLSFDLYQEPEIQDSQNIYNMRKYMQIIPNFEQTIINEQELLNNHTSADSAKTNISLGNDDLEEQLWEYNKSDKYIKLRLESKSSGRKMDINLYFKIKTPTN